MITPPTCNHTHKTNVILTSPEIKIWRKSPNRKVLNFISGFGPALIILKKSSEFYTQQATAFRKNCLPPYKSSTLGAAKKNIFSTLSSYKANGPKTATMQTKEKQSLPRPRIHSEETILPWNERKVFLAIVSKAIMRTKHDIEMRK